MKRKVLVILLTCLMVLTLLPMAAEAVTVDRNVMLSADGISVYSSEDGYDYIYFGQYNASPVKWLVLDNQGASGGTYKDSSDAAVDSSDVIFLLSEYTLGGNTYFSYDSSPQWSSSSPKTNCADVYNSAFTASEKALVLKTTTTADADVGGEAASPYLLACQLNDDTLFALSADEATRSAYGFGAWDSTGADSGRVTLCGNHPDTATPTWLRSSSSVIDPPSPLFPATYYAGAVNGEGLITYYSCDGSYLYIRPAFNLNSSSVLFSSAAAFDKTAAFAVNDAYSGSEWKLTFADGNTTFAASMADTEMEQGDTATVNVTDLGSGTDYTQVSAMLVDEGGDVICYGRIGDAATGEKTFAIPSDLEMGTYTLRVFAEDVNGVNLTDYAGNTVDITLSIGTLQNEYVTGSKVRLTDDSVWFVLAEGFSRVTLIKDGFLSGTYTRSAADTAIADYQSVVRATFDDEGATTCLPQRDDLAAISDICDFSDLSYYWLGDLDGGYYYCANGTGGVGSFLPDYNPDRECAVRPVATLSKSAAAAVEAVITQQPQDLDWPALNGAAAVFDVTVNGENITYQWQVLDGTDWTDIAGATTGMLTVPAGDANYAEDKTFRCKIYSDWGEYIYSSEAVLRTFNWQEYGAANAVTYSDYLIDSDDEYDQIIYVYTAAGLGWVADQVNNSDDGLAGQQVVLAADVDLTGRAWIPIGYDNSYAFEADFDGNLCSVKGLDIDYQGEYVGLFGYVKDATIENLFINDGTIRISGPVELDGLLGFDGCFAGILFGYGNSSTFRNIGVGQVELAGNADNLFIGGIGGYFSGKEGCVIKNCYSRAAISSANTYALAGGIAGCVNNGSTIANCYFAGSFDLSGGESVYLGGIAGEFDEGIANTVSNCYWQTGCGAVCGHWNCLDDMTASDQGCSPLTETQMKTASGDDALLPGLNDWVTIANGSENVFQPWVVVDSQNDGYPTFFIAYDLAAEGVRVTNVNCANVLGDEGTPTVVFDPASSKLTLNNADIAISDDNDGYTAAIEGAMSLQIVLTGTNTVSGSGTEQVGIYLSNDGGAQSLAFSGSGTLTAAGTTAAVCVKTYGGQQALSLASNLKIKEGGSIAHEHAGARDFWTFCEGTFDSSDIASYAKHVVIGAKASSSSGGNDYYTITATAGAGGSISPTGKVNVEASTDKTFTVTPEDCYVIDDVKIDGVSAGAVGSYTFSNVQAAHTIAAVFAKAAEAGWVNPYQDVKSSDWFYSAVAYVTENGLMNGTGATAFEPNLATTRAMIVTILWRLENQPAGSVWSSFFDVADDDYYAEAVAWAEQNGIVKGYDADSYGPNDNITREQLAAILYRYASYKGYDLTASADLAEYADANDISEYALTSFKWAVAEGLITGMTESTLAPQSDATRAQVAAILMRLIESING